MNSVFPNNRGRRQDRRGQALLIVLAFVVLLTVLVLGFLSKALTSRQLSKSSASQAKADMLARSAADIVVSDLKQEIVKGSNATTTGAYTIYQPKVAANMLPQLDIIPPATVADIANLIRESIRSDSIASPGISSQASAVSTTDVSENGRSISAARWNSHYLIPRSNPGGASVDTTPISKFTPPDWVIVTRNGPTAFTSWNSNLNNSSPSNTSYAVGRYAFAVYDEGGLLDMNVAGSPSGLTATQSGLKGALALADLTQLPVTPPVTQTQIDQIVGWRNNATAQPGLTGSFGGFSFTGSSPSNWFTNFVTANTNGFTAVVPTAAPTDQAFLSRQQLIQMFNTLGISQDALQYLGTFTRVLNAPSWWPTQNASDLGGSGDTYAYKTNADTAGSPNRFFPNVRVRNPFVRADGTTALVGEPLIKTRFPLSRLAGLTYQGIDTADNTTLINGVLSSATATTIQRDFGLIWNEVTSTSPAGYSSATPGYPGYWSYVGASGSTIQGAIETLDQVASENREPNFFELLKAGILSGSLGKQGYSQACLIDPSQFSTGGLDSEVDNQIIQIGANIIDQSDADSFPTAIAFNSNYTPVPVIYGNENLPGLANVFFDAYRYQGQPNVTMYGTNYYMPYVGMWLKPIVWNPYANAATAPNPKGGPTKFRFVATGSVIPELGNYGNVYYHAIPGPSGGSQGVSPYPPHPNLGITLPDYTTTQAYEFLNGGNPPTPTTLSDTFPDANAATLPNEGKAGGSLVFTFSTAYGGFSEPTNLSSPLNGAAAYGKDAQTGLSIGGNSVGFYGLWIGDVFAPDLLQNPLYPLPHPYPMQDATNPATDPDAALAPVNEWNYAGLNTPTGLSYELQYWNGNNWQVYDVMRHIVAANGLCDNERNAGNSSYPGDSSLNCYQLPRMVMEDLRSDPRTDRFGSMCTYNLPAPGADFKSNGNVPQPVFQSIRINTTYNPTQYSGNYSDWLMAFNGPQVGAPGWTYQTPGYESGAPCAAWLGVLSDNFPTAFSASITSYKDPDGVMRAGDGAYISNSTGTAGYPLIAGNTNSRPVMLDRPFRSVGELGFVDRGMPWKTLDFFTANSADAALLDLFSVSESPSIIAGTINLNTRQQPVLQAAMAGALKDVADGSSPISSSTELSGLVTSITNITRTTPLQNRSELATIISPVLNYDSPDPDNGSKPRREAVVRALSSVGETRTWNLLIDVVAQAGRYPPTASQLSQFVVEGERHYWLHVAIDRFTGQVVSQSMELVNE